MPQRSSENRLLSVIVRERPAVLARCEAIHVSAGTALYTEGQSARYVYFPTRGLACMVVQLAAGESSEVLTLGRDDLIGLSVWLGVERSLESITQLHSGELVRIGGRAFCDAIKGSRRIRELLHHYTAYTFRVGAQLSACNMFHDVEQRTCRWLLTSLDQSGSREIALSQGALATVLGVRRQTLGAVALRLQQSGLIAYRRGVIRVVDRSGLASRACECYHTVRELYDDVLGELLRPR